MAVRRTHLAISIGAVVSIAIASCAESTEPESTTTGVPSPATSTVSVSNATLVSGTPVIVTLQAKTAAGVNLAIGGATVAFALGTSPIGPGVSAGTFGVVTDNNNGTYSATFTGTTAGTARGFTATLNGSAVATVMPTVTVTAGPASLSQSEVTTSAATLNVGAVATLTLRVRDAAGNNHTTGWQTVTFTKGAGTSDGTIGTVTDNENGTYSATFTATTAGSARTIGATLDGAAITSGFAAITVNAAAPAHAGSRSQLPRRESPTRY